MKDTYTHKELIEILHRLAAKKNELPVEHRLGFMNGLWEVLREIST